MHREALAISFAANCLNKLQFFGRFSNELPSVENNQIGK